MRTPCFVPTDLNHSVTKKENAIPSNCPEYAANGTPKPNDLLIAKVSYDYWFLLFNLPNY